MKSHLLHGLRIGILLGAVQLAIAQDQTVTGNLSATGTLDINGNTASFGTSGVNPGYSLIYTDGSPAIIDFSASASGADWFWHQGTSSPQLKLSNSNVLTLFSPATGTAAITLTPNGTTAFTAAAGGITTELLSLSSPGNESDTAQRISGQTDVLSGYLDFKRFSSSGPATGLTLGTLGGDVLTIRSGGSAEAGNVGIGTTAPTAKLDVAGNVKITGSLTATGTVTAPSVTLPDGSTLTSARTTTLYNAAGQPVAAVSSDGKVNFTNGLSVGTDQAATITPASVAYLNQTLANLGFTENPVQATLVKTLAYTGQVEFKAIAQDASYIYVIGQVSGSGSIGGASFYVNSGATSFAIAKLNQNGTAVWVRMINGNVNLKSVAVDGSGNVIVAGQFSGTTTGLSSPASNLTSNGNGSDGLVVKYNASGASQWAQRIGGSGSDSLSSVAVDGSGSVIVAGQFYGTTTGLSSPASNLTSNGNSDDGLVVKYNASGASQWAQRIGGSNYDSLSSVAVDGSGNVIVAGSFSGTTTGLSSPASNLTANGLYSDGIVVKYNADGASQWAQRIGGSGSDSLSSVAVDGSGSVVAAGYFSNTTTGLSSPANNLTANGSSDGMVVKYNASGASQWAQRIGGSNYDSLSSVAVDGSGNVIVAGSFSGTTTGLSSPASNLTANGYYDGMLVSYNASGASQWAQSLGGSKASITKLVIYGNAMWAIGATDSGSVAFGDSRIVQGPFAIGWSGFPVVAPVAGTAAALAWGGSMAKDDGVALGSSAYANGSGSAAVGAATASAQNAFASGTSTAQADSATAMGLSTIARSHAATAMGESTIASGGASTAMGYYSIASGQQATAMGCGSIASGEQATALGCYATASGAASTAMGLETTASAWAATAMGERTTASGGGATAMGVNTTASGYVSTAMGLYTTASGEVATALGESTTASGYTATATGFFTTASGYAATAMGQETTASGEMAVATGLYSVASGDAATAMGVETSASGYAATSMGNLTFASGYAATAMGVLNAARGDSDHPQPTDDLLVVGNGDLDTWESSNALAVHRNGNMRVAGNIQSKGGVRVPPMGDLSMGTFTAGANPADPETGLNAGLRYPTE